MENSSFTLAVALLAGANTVISLLILFILADLRDRLRHLERLEMHSARGEETT